METAADAEHPTGRRSRWICRRTSGPADTRRRARRCATHDAEGRHRDGEGRRTCAAAAAPASRPAGSGAFVPHGAGRPTPASTSSSTPTRWSRARSRTALLMEGDPHQLIEGMILSGLRHRGRRCLHLSALGVRRSRPSDLQRAIAEAVRARLSRARTSSDPVTASSCTCTSARAATSAAKRRLCSNALEGKRANPRAKPPFPQVSGLWGKPTIVNNVETLCNVPHIVEHGAEWFKGLSRTEDGGTKLYGVSGRVKRPGMWELPMGTPHARDPRGTRRRHAGRVARSAALLPGRRLDRLPRRGAPRRADGLRVDVQKAGSRLGTGTMIVLDDQTCPVGMVRNLEHFFAQESCGWCTPCREGLPWAEPTAAGAWRTGTGEPGDLEMLGQHARLPGSGQYVLRPRAGSGRAAAERAQVFPRRLRAPHPTNTAVRWRH